MISALCVALGVVSVYALAITALWRKSAASVRTLMDRWARANGQFMSCDLELNRTKVALAKALMQAQARK